MFYSFELNQFPAVKKFYEVTRNTFWQISDKDNIFILITKGRCCISIQGRRYELKEGDIFFIPQNTSYSREPIDNALCTMTYIHFSTESAICEEEITTLTQNIEERKRMLDQEILSGESTPSFPSTIYLQNHSKGHDVKTIKNLIKGISLFSANRQLTCNMKSSVTLCSLFVLLSQHTIDLITADSSIRNEIVIPPNLKKAISYIAQHYTEQIMLDDLTACLNVSKQQLIRYFKRAFRTTPNAYITDYKLTRAKEMLFNYPHLTIKEIAMELGFENQHYFSRVFSKTYGETPTNYRDRTINYGKEKKES